MSAARHKSVSAHAGCMQVSSRRTTAAKAIYNTLVKKIPPSNYHVLPAPIIMKQTVSPVPGASVT